MIHAVENIVKNNIHGAIYKRINQPQPHKPIFKKYAQWCTILLYTMVLPNRIRQFYITIRNNKILY